MISFQPLIARARRKLLHGQPLEAVADRTETWAPGSTSEYRPIIQLPDEGERIIAFEKPSAKDEYIRFCSSGALTHKPTLAHHYKRATIADGMVFANGSMKAFNDHPGRSPVMRRGVGEHLRDQILATSWVTETYFGHWVTDGLALELLAQDRPETALGVARKPWVHEPGYRALVDLQLHRTAFAEVEGLWVVNDESLNQRRTDRFRTLRERIRAGATNDRSGPPVFILRDGGAARPLLNQQALADFLARRGFTILSPEAESVDGLVAAFRNAPLVVSVEGSALCHPVMAMPEGGTILAIQPPRRVTCIQKNNTDWAGLRMAHTVADDAGTGFTLGEDRLMRILDLIERS